MPPAMSNKREIRKLNMIKTLRITSIIAAVLAGGFFVFPAVFGFRGDEQIKQFLNSPTAVERFRQASGQRGPGSKPQISPLVRQAGKFASYLNPPQPPKLKKPRTERQALPAIAKPEPSVTPKFKLVATSFYESSPEMSLALIDEPGKGQHWVRQSAVVSHLTIEQIKDGLVIVKGSKGPFELVVEKPPERSLLAGSSPVPVGDESTSAPPAPQASHLPRRGTRITSDTPHPQLSPEERKEAELLAEKLFAELDAMRGGIESDKIDTGRGTMLTEELFSGRGATRVSSEEAERLGDLGKELKDMEQKLNQTKVREASNRRADRRAQIIRDRLKRAKAQAEPGDSAEK